MQAVSNASAYFANWNVADPGHPIHKTEHKLTQDPKSLTVVQYPMDKKLVLSQEMHWKYDHGQGRITALVHRSFSFLRPFWDYVTTRIEEPALEPLFENAEREYSIGDEQTPLVSRKDKEEYVPLVSVRRVKQVHPPFNLTREGENFYFYDSHTLTRSRAIPEEALVAAVCGSPQPHIGVATYHLQGITANGVPDIMIALKEKGQKSERVHTIILTRTIARLFGFDNRDKLVAVGEVRENDSEVSSKFAVPPQRVITAKRIDVTVSTLLGASIFGVLVATYKTNPGAISILAGGVSCLWLFNAYSRSHRKD